jgi:hypothetical protein
VASHQQLNAALALVFQTEGVEQVANGLTVWAGDDGPTGTAASGLQQHMIASKSRADSGVAPPSSDPTGVTPEESVASQEPLLGTQEAEVPTPPDTPLRNPEVVTEPENRVSTARTVCYWAAVRQGPIPASQMVTTLMGSGEAMLPPGEAGGFAGEAFVSDGDSEAPALLPVEETAMPGGEPEPSLVQSPPKPSRRAWAGGLGGQRLPRGEAFRFGR